MKRLTLTIVATALCAACATKTPIDEHARTCAVLAAVAENHNLPELPSKLATRVNEIPQTFFPGGDIVCGETAYPRGAERGVSYVGAAFSLDGRYAAVQTHWQNGPYSVVGYRCLVRHRRGAWRNLGCSMQYIS